MSCNRYNDQSKYNYEGDVYLDGSLSVLIGLLCVLWKGLVVG